MTTLTGAPHIGDPRPRAMGPRTSVINRIMVRLLGSDLRPLIEKAVSGLRYTARSGATIVLPVQTVQDRRRIVVLAGNADKKRWWRHFSTPATVHVWHDGQWYGGIGTVVIGRDNDDAAAYRRAYPRRTLPADATFVVVTFPEPLGPRPPLRGRPLARAWFWAVTAAETLGFAVAACVGALTANAGAAVVVLSLLAAGAVEGATLGWGQAIVLRHALSGLSRRRWVAATAGAAALAYLIGLVPSTFAESMADGPPRCSASWSRCWVAACWPASARPMADPAPPRRPCLALDRRDSRRVDRRSRRLPEYRDAAVAARSGVGPRRGDRRRRWPANGGHDLGDHRFRPAQAPSIEAGGQGCL